MRETGEILVDVECDNHQRIRRATISNERVPGVIDRLALTPGVDLRQTVPLLYSLCPAAHLVTLDAAERAAAGITEDDRRAVDFGFAERALMFEALLENIRLLVIDSARLLSLEVDPQALTEYAALRAQFAGVLHTLGSFKMLTKPVDASAIERGHATIDQVWAPLQNLLTNYLFGVTPVDYLKSLTDIKTFDAWVDANAKRPVSVLATRYDALEDAFGHMDCPMLLDVGDDDFSIFADEMLHRLKNEPGFDMTPVWRRAPALTGALPRQIAHPLIREMVDCEGMTAKAILAARLLETAALHTRLGRDVPTNIEGLSGPYHVYTHFDKDQSVAISMTQSARGLLTHATGFRSTENGLRRFHAVVSPTEWQFAPEGPGQQALNAVIRYLKRTKTDHCDAGITSIIRLAMFGLDPCVPLSVRLRRTNVIHRGFDL